MKSLVEILKILSVTLVAFGIISFVSASGSWQSGGTFMQSNASKPINVGSQTQVKQGPLLADGFASYGTGYFSTTSDYVLNNVFATSNLTLGVNGSLGASIFCDKLGTNCISSLSDASSNNSIPPHMVMAFASTSCAAGWNEYVPARGRYIEGLNPGGTLGAQVGQALTDMENRPTGQHTHPFSDPGHRHALQGYKLNDGAGTRYDVSEPVDPSLPGSSVNPSAANFIKILPSTGDAGVAGTNAPYVQFIYCEKI